MIIDMQIKQRVHMPMKSCDQEGIWKTVKACSTSFEPPDNDLCSACPVYPLSRETWIISILFILNRLTWGLIYII